MRPISKPLSLIHKCVYIIGKPKGPISAARPFKGKPRPAKGKPTLFTGRGKGKFNPFIGKPRLASLERGKPARPGKFSPDKPRGKPRGDRLFVALSHTVV